jgi:hypothetical protein
MTEKTVLIIISIFYCNQILNLLANINSTVNVKKSKQIDFKQDNRFKIEFSKRI